MKLLSSNRRRIILLITVLVSGYLACNPRREPLRFFLPKGDCSISLTSNNRGESEKSNVPQLCLLGEASGRDTGEKQWRVVIQSASDRASVLELANEVTGERGRYEVECEANRVTLLAFKRFGEQTYRQVDLTNRHSTDLSRLPEEYQRQMLRLCPAKATVDNSPRL